MILSTIEKIRNKIIIIIKNLLIMIIMALITISGN